jgi:hypothetical protein
MVFYFRRIYKMYEQIFILVKMLQNGIPLFLWRSNAFVSTGHFNHC